MQQKVRTKHAPSNSRPEHLPANYGRISSILVAATSFLRALPLFIAARPKTPLRVLCIVAFDTLHVLRTSNRLPVRRIRMLAALLDFGASANAAFDRKEFSPEEFRCTRQLLEEAVLFGIVMQCQIIDDVLDFSKDAAAGLPSLLTAATSLPQAFELTHEAALGYTNVQHLRHTAETFPLRLALSAVSACARLVIALGCWRQRISVPGRI